MHHTMLGSFFNVMLSVVMLNFMLYIALLGVIMLNVVMENVVAPFTPLTMRVVGIFEN